MENAFIEFKDVKKSFDNRTILKNVNLKIFKGDVTTIIGKSGTGKSVLLKHIIGLLKPDEGSIYFQGKAINRMSRSEWNDYIGKISYMFQNNALFDSLTVFENIALPLRQTTNLHKKQIEAKVMARIEQTELTEVAHKYPSELSGGMQKRAALSRALVTEPKIVLFDEPTTGQDLIRRNAILGMIAEYQRKLGFTAILISHDLPDVFFISNRIVALHEGEVVFQGTPEELDDFDHPFLDEFIQSLEGFQEHLTGLYSRRNFMIRYQNALGRKHPSDTFTVAVFSLRNLDIVSENLGHTAVQKVLKSFGEYINNHCDAVGGISARQSQDQFITIFPFSNLKEAEQIIEVFEKDLHGRGLCEFKADIHISLTECFEFGVFVGLAEGNHSDEISQVFNEAKSRQKPMARFHCEMRR
jgi:phospholipid/cholesterol/gamma-HCH transport system ATP-binding protein